MIKKSTLITALLVILLTYVNNPFYFIGITALHKLAYYVLALLPFVLKLKKGIKNNANNSSFLLYFAFYFILAILVVLETGSFDFQYLTYFVRILVSIFASISVYYLWEKFFDELSIGIDYGLLYLKSVSFYIWGTIIFISCPPLKTLWGNLLADLGKTDFSDFLEYITRFGFAGFSGFGCAFMVTCACVVLIMKYLNNELPLYKMKYYSFIFVIGSFFYGRVGFVVTVLLLGFTSLYLFLQKRPRLFFFYMRILLVLALIIFAIYWIIQDSQPFIEWLFEPAFNYFEKGSFESASTNGLKKFYENFHPSENTLLFGDGFWMDSHGNGYYGHTDVGFMRNIYYGGIFYTAFLYFVPLLFVLLFFIEGQNKGIKNLFFICLCMVVQLIFFEIKGDIAFMFIKMYFPFFIMFINKKRQTEDIGVLYVK